jgi:beta-galactosidase
VWQPGKLEAVGWVAGKPVARHQLETTGEAVKLRLTPITGPGGAIASGSDVIIVDVEALDAQDRRVPTFYGRVDFLTDGPVTWRGGYNSGRIKSTNHTWLELECGINRVVLRTNRQAGTMKLTATSKGLADGTCSVPVQGFDAAGGWTVAMPVPPTPPALVELPVPAADDGPAVSAGGGPAKQAKLIKGASYSGPGEKIAFRTARKGAGLYTDHGEKLAELPDRLKGAEMICLPNADWNYSAVDLLQFEAKKDLTIYIMHDDRLAAEKMDWLKNDFTDSGIDIKGGENRKWSLYQRNVNKGDTVLLGSNCESKGEKRWMMVVFCVPR